MTSIEKKAAKQHARTLLTKDKRRASVWIEYHRPEGDLQWFQYELAPGSELKTLGAQLSAKLGLAIKVGESKQPIGTNRFNRENKPPRHCPPTVYKAEPVKFDDWGRIHKEGGGEEDGVRPGGPQRGKEWLLDWCCPCLDLKKRREFHRRAVLVQMKKESPWQIDQWSPPGSFSAADEAELKRREEMEPTKLHAHPIDGRGSHKVIEVLAWEVIGTSLLRELRGDPIDVFFGGEEIENLDQRWEQATLNK